ncbi:MAG: type II and III secretion system protein family protein, partial [Gemmatimonadetes bacterium]|nr:type II and III secretion system protein family protein [Gemmatimonadota bacterium]NIT68373.1 type II and III secretion system protein family protein [Gemmatimonadota bacterium]NIY36950.1 type II and III secretion system protein family protein [Gemmatimonadota bacterium]
NLRVRIAEVSRDIKNKFGFNWDFLLSGNFVLGLATSFSTVGATTTAQYTDTFGDASIDGLIDALADDGLITILAEPNLTALSGETASFLAGGEFPIPVSQDSDSITVEFKEFGVGLAFTPTVIGTERISMRVRPEVSQLSTAASVSVAGTSIPGLTTRRAETTVELASGQSFAIAGLLLDDSQEAIQKTPGLGDLPILGALFKSESFQRKETELIIIVTPYLVRPVSTGDLPLPTDPLTKGAPGANVTRNTTVSQTIPLPEGASAAAGQTGSAGYILD